MPQPLPPIERWSPVEGFVFRYEVSSLGRIRRVTRQRGTFAGRIIAGTRASRGGRKVWLWRDGIRVSMLVHNLVAQAFLKRRPPGAVIGFRDGNRNNTALTNLYWRPR